MIFVKFIKFSLIAYILCIGVLGAISYDLFLFRPTVEFQKLIKIPVTFSVIIITLFVIVSIFRTKHGKNGAIILFRNRLLLAFAMCLLVIPLSTFFSYSFYLHSVGGIYTHISGESIGPEVVGFELVAATRKSRFLCEHRLNEIRTPYMLLGGVRFCADELELEDKSMYFIRLYLIQSNIGTAIKKWELTHNK